MQLSFRPLTGADVLIMEPLLKEDGMVFDLNCLYGFFGAPNTCSFGAFDGERLVGMAYAYLLPRPDGKTMFFLYSLGLLEPWQNKGIGTQFMAWLTDYAREIGCSELFVITDKGNPRACRIYEKAGGKSDYEDEIVYVIDFEKEESRGI